MNTTKNKRKKAAVAVATAAAILLAGTFAWTSISQTAKNEAVVDINPGARLHDDFDGINKDVYVENFGDEETGVDIYARIRLDEYMEVGQEAGTNKDDADRKALPVVEGTDINDKSTWNTFVYGDETQQRAYAKYWTWDMGNAESHRPYYMPTFNKNKDSLEPDINGTYEGLNAGDIVHYDDYVPYDADSSITADAVYDWDLNTIDEVEEGSPVITTDETTPLDEANVLQKSEPHNAQQITSGATILTMEEWKALPEDQQVGPYWVYDTDGWAYWAQPIAPGETTGLLLDGIHMSRVPDDNWYYGINVIGQFVTSADLSAFTRDGDTVTDDAIDLITKLTGAEMTAQITGPDRVIGGENAQYTASAQANGLSYSEQPEVIWSVTDEEGSAVEGVSISADGVLKVTSDYDTVPHGTELVITAEAEDGSFSSTKNVTVKQYLPMEGTITYTGSENPYDFSGDYVNYDVDFHAGEEIIVTLNREIDFDTTLANSMNQEYIDQDVMSIEPVEGKPDTVKVTFGEAASTGGLVHNEDHMMVYNIQFRVYTEKEGEYFYLQMFIQPMETDSVDATLHTTSNGIAQTTTLHDGAVVSAGSKVTAEYTGTGNLRHMDYYLYDTDGNRMEGYTYDYGSNTIIADESAPDSAEAVLRFAPAVYVDVDGVEKLKQYYKDYRITVTK